jgi:hypothetical protein
MGKDKKSKEVPVSVYVEAKKRYLEQLQQILTPRLYEGFESLYDDALELLENEFEEKRQQTKSILKTFQDALKEIPIWNQDIIEHEAERIVQVSNCDYLDDLIDALFKAESKILTSVQTMNKSTRIHVKVPIASHFIHRCYICSAREIFKNPFVFNHFKDLTPRDKQNNLREAVFMINEGITNAVRELLPIRDILKSSIHNAELSGTESDYSSDNSSNTSNSSDSDSDSERRGAKLRRKHKKHEVSSESESSCSEESESENEEEVQSLKEVEVELNESEKHILDSEESKEVQISEESSDEEAEEESSDEEEEEDSSDEEEEEKIELLEEQKEDNSENKQEGGFTNFISNIFTNNKEETQNFEEREERESEVKESIKLDELDNIFQPSEQNNVENEFVDDAQSFSEVSAKPIQEIKQIVFEGNKIPKEYRQKDDVFETPEQEIVNGGKIEEAQSLEEVKSEIIYKDERNDIEKQRTEYKNLSDLKSKESKKIKKEVSKFVKPMPVTHQIKNRDESLNKLIQKQRDFYKKHLSQDDNMSILSGTSTIKSRASLISNDSRTKLIDNYLNKEPKKSISYLSTVMQNKSLNEEDEDSGEEYLSDPELNN